MLKAGAKQARIVAINAQQFAGPARFDNAPARHDDDSVCVLHRGQTVGYDQRGAVLHEPLQGLLHRPLGLGVQRRGGLVQDQYRRVLVQCTGDGQALALSA